jgi:hypothetical protein
MSSVARRVSDRHMLHLIKQWIVVPVEDEDGVSSPPSSLQLLPAGATLAAWGYLPLRDRASTPLAQRRQYSRGLGMVLRCQL